MRNIGLVIFTICAGLLAAPPGAIAYDVYYVSVGNAHYRESGLDIPDANLSARQITYHLRKMGAVDGVTLLSKEGAYLTYDDVIDALDRVVDQASEAEDPLLVYYFIGHGRTTEPGGVHVSLTGSYRKPPSGSDARRYGVIDTKALRERLDERRIPYLLILDNCYFRQPVDGLVAFGRTLSDKLMQQGDILGGLSFGGDDEPRDPRIVLYAAAPGNVVRTAPHPWSERYSVGSLARRLLLLLDATLKAGRQLSVGAFLETMNDGSFDPLSAVGHKTVNLKRPAATLVPPGEKAEPDDALGEVREGSAGE